MSVTVICAAIQGRNQISFRYSEGKDPGPRLVEPYMVAYNQAGHLTLSAWFLGGNSESQEGQGWREYLLSGISNVTVLRQQFATPRPGYHPSGGKAYHSIQCAV
jgi:predicted DNA-binding transcriptional regulator YafY